MRISIILALLLTLTASSPAQPTIHPSGPAAKPRHPPTNPKTMEEDELQRREEAATWLVLRLAGGIGVGVVLLGGAVLLGRRRARRREAEA